MTDDDRSPRSVYSLGEEPEVQASLANERREPWALMVRTVAVLGLSAVVALVLVVAVALDA